MERLRTRWRMPRHASRLVSLPQASCSATRTAARRSTTPATEAARWAGRGQAGVACALSRGIAGSGTARRAQSAEHLNVAWSERFPELKAVTFARSGGSGYSWHRSCQCAPRLSPNGRTKTECVVQPRHSIRLWLRPLPPDRPRQRRSHVAVRERRDVQRERQYLQQGASH